MSLSLGIVGLPNVGKSTLFNALTRSKQADAQNYPFCTIEPNVGIVTVPDDRLEKLAIISKSKKIIPTVVEFVDIAGLVKGASEGEGLGNKFLSRIREVNAIVQVARVFEDGNITHVHNKIDPKEDADVINLELVLADMQTAAKRFNTVAKNAKGAASPDAKMEMDLLERVKKQFEAGKPARLLEYTEDEMKIMKDLNLLTMKPLMYVLNSDEKMSGSDIKLDGETVLVCAKLESELADLSLAEAKEYMKELNMTQSGLDKIIAAGYKLLNLATYFTSGEPETRAWTVKAGTLAPDAAAVIHTDFAKGFVKADVTKWQDFVKYNGWHGVKENGKMQLVGKDYIVEDGDVCYFHIAT